MKFAGFFMLGFHLLFLSSVVNIILLLEVVKCVRSWGIFMLKVTPEKCWLMLLFLLIRNQMKKVVFVLGQGKKHLCYKLVSHTI